MVPGGPLQPPQPVPPGPAQDSVQRNQRPEPEPDEQDEAGYEPAVDEGQVVQVFVGEEALPTDAEDHGQPTTQGSQTQHQEQDAGDRHLPGEMGLSAMG
ncbi:MAG: hypothetical protein ABWY62_06705 [Acidimicrobiia bacterium]